MTSKKNIQRYIHWATCLHVLICAGFFSAYAQAQTDIAGSMPGQFVVDPSGAATYSIPIQVPPGVAGMQPKLALVYNSHIRTGLAGVGWNLSGLSSISRCPRTMASDGVRGAVQLDMNDRYCMDGQRLMLVSGTYGAAGSEYRTEKETFSKITAYGSMGNGPSYFIVKTKAGLTMEYGNTEKSKALNQAGTTVRAWALNQISDVKSNLLRVTYDKTTDHSVQVPLTIVYGYNPSTQAFQRSVTIEYDQDIPDKSMGFVAGSQVQVDRRIRAIKTAVAGQTAKVYLLDYTSLGTASALKSHLTQVTEFSGDQTKRLFPTSITYEAPFGGAEYKTNPIPSTSIAYPDDAISTDFNGDGLTDLFLRWRNTGTNRLFLNQGDGQFTKYEDPIGSPMDGELRVGDFNGDGLSDLLVDVVAATNHLYLSQGNGQFTVWGASVGDGQTLGNALTGDFNGDGLSDIFTFDRYSGNSRLLVGGGANGQWTEYWLPISPGLIGPEEDNVSWTGTHYANVIPGDFNGDGLTDLYFYWPALGSNRLLFSQGNGSFSLGAYNPIPVTEINYSPIVQTGDFNGDGLTDLFFYWKEGSYGGVNKLYLGRGNGQFAQYLNPIGAPEFSATSIKTGDFNGDGLTDIYFIWGSTGANKIYLSRGEGQFAEFATPIVASEITAYPRVLDGDFNGDGLSDAYFVWNTGNNKLFMPGITSVGRAKSIQSGPGRYVNLSYTPLTNGSVYTKDSGANKAVFPKQDLQSALRVVSQVDQSNGVGGVNTTQYQYGGFKAELGTGRGILGFRWTESTEVVTGLESFSRYSEYWQTYPYVGLPSKSENRSGTQLLKRSVSTYACQNPQTGAACTGAAGNRYFPYVSQAVEESWDLNGSTFPVITTSYVYGQSPQYGDPTQITVANSVDGTMTTVNTYTNDVANWILGRLTRSQVTSTNATAPGPLPPGQTNQPFVFTQTLSTNTLDYNIKNAAIAAGWDQSLPLNATVTINAGVYVGSSSASTPAFDTGSSFPTGSTLTLVNYGYIVGAGGNGGDAATDYNYYVGRNGSPGGAALKATSPIHITNMGTIGGGGGGGGGGTPAQYDDYGMISTANGGGGGGGRGSVGGVGKSGGVNGTTTSAGAGGAGYANYIATLGYSMHGGAGGTGGGLGASGTSGMPGDMSASGGVPGGPGSGGAPGAAVIGNSNVTWGSTGTRLGAVQ